MPTYAYRCASCGHAFDVFQNLRAAPWRTCPACVEPAAERQISGGAGVIFRGSGFHATDYRKRPQMAGATIDRFSA